jgi:hypothetical protein
LAGSLNVAMVTISLLHAPRHLPLIKHQIDAERKILTSECFAGWVNPGRRIAASALPEGTIGRALNRRGLL